MNKILLYSLMAIMILGFGCESKRDEVRLLVFSKTAGYRHQSIDAGKLAIIDLAKEKGWAVDTTEDADVFEESNLAQYSAVIFLSTTQDVLDIAQQRDFERYIQSGGGYVGIHAASDTEYDWPWYGRLVGAYFTSHPNNPNVLEGEMNIVNKDHPSTSFFGQNTWVRSDEFYNFKKIYHGPEDGIIPLINIDESSYSGGTNGEFHPMSWYHEYDGGRAFYTNFGHTPETFSEPDFLKHLAGGIEYAVGKNLTNDYSKAHSERYPDEGRFEITILTEGLNEPEELDILPDGKVLFIQRRGELRLYHPETGETTDAGNLSVFHQRSNGSNVEEGLVGLSLDPNFETNNWIYLYYAPEGDEDLFRLSRFEFVEDNLRPETEEIIMTVPIQRRECCHTGGSIQFAEGNIMFLSTGDNTNPFETAYAPINELDDRYPWDAQKSSGNMNDLRGKVLRIKINDDATYDIPDGNLFPKDGSEGRPEIYVMGCRNPYRISIDSKTGFLYWGDVGPDGRVDSTRGPRGYDEVNQARKPGFFGWPYFIADNKPYAEVDFETGEIGELFDAAHPVNNSPNNTGKQNLPPAQPAFIYYPYNASSEFPMLAAGGRNAMAGPVFHQSDFGAEAATFPSYYEDKLLIYDFMRDWVFAVNMTEEGDLDLIEPFLPNSLSLSSPMDMQFGPDGSLYILEYGTRWFAENRDARLIKVTYQSGNRSPMAEIDLAETHGAAPFEVPFSAGTSSDPDGDELSFAWDFGDGESATGSIASHTYTEPGEYTATLTVSDNNGGSQEREVLISVGNAPPSITLQVEGNKTFFWKEEAKSYSISVEDAEDGRTGAEISADRVAASVEFLDQTEDLVLAALGHEEATARSLASYGKELIAESGCIACHSDEKKIVGPAYRDVAKRYAEMDGVREYLVGKILNGGSGVWGGAAMAAQEQLNENQATAMAAYIMTLAEGEAGEQLPLDGQLTFNDHSQTGEGSSYLLTVSYQDEGSEEADPIRRDLSVRFRAPVLVPDDANLEESTKVDYRGDRIRMSDEDILSYGQIDFTGLETAVISYRSTEGAILKVMAGEEILGTAEVSEAGRGDHQVRVDLQETDGMHPFRLVVEAPEGNENPTNIFVLETIGFPAPR